MKTEELREKLRRHEYHDKTGHWPSKKTTTGVWRDRNRWGARWFVDGKMKYLGSYGSKKEALAAVQKYRETKGET